MRRVYIKDLPAGQRFLLAGGWYEQAGIYEDGHVRAICIEGSRDWQTPGECSAFHPGQRVSVDLVPLVG